MKNNQTNLVFLADWKKRKQMDGKAKRKQEKASYPEHTPLTFDIEKSYVTANDEEDFSGMLIW